MFIYVHIINIHFHVGLAHFVFLLCFLVFLIFKSHNLVLFLVWKLDLDLSFNLCSCESSCPWHLWLRVCQAKLQFVLEGLGCWNCFILKVKLMNPTSFWPYCKKHSTPNIIFYQTINLVAHLKVEFQDAMMYQIEIEKTWFIIKALPTLMIFILVQKTSFSLRLRKSLSKLTSLGNVKPICKSKYCTPLLFTTHTRHFFIPKCNMWV